MVNDLLSEGSVVNIVNSRWWRWTERGQLVRRRNITIARQMLRHDLVDIIVGSRETDRFASGNRRHIWLVCDYKVQLVGATIANKTRPELFADRNTWVAKTLGYELAKTSKIYKFLFFELDWILYRWVLISTWTLQKAKKNTLSSDGFHLLSVAKNFEVQITILTKHVL